MGATTFEGVDVSLNEAIRITVLNTLCDHKVFVLQRKEMTSIVSWIVDEYELGKRVRDALREENGLM